MPNSLRRGWFLYFLLLCVVAVWSYGLTAPNLILTGWEPYWNFQLWMWRTFFDQSRVLTFSYAILVSLLFILYLVLWHQSKKVTLSGPKLRKVFLSWWTLLLLPLWIGYNALSHDIFNYIFNARMIVLYHANPYERMTLDFAYDDWTRFMHNTHTLAPYGYGWTLFSVIPYLLGWGKFLVTWLLFKILGPISLILQALVTLFKTTDEDRGVITMSDLVLTFLHPLILLEFGLSAHNDAWMMAPAVLSLVLLEKRWRLKNGWKLALSALLLALSISMKLVTFLVLPIWVGLVLAALVPWRSFKKSAFTYWPVVASVVIFATLFTARSQYFHPWYISWILVWLPFFPHQVPHTWLKQPVSFIKYLIWCFALTSLYRYLPWMWAGGYPPEVIMLQRMITFSAIPLAIITFLAWKLLKPLSISVRKSLQLSNG